MSRERDESPKRVYGAWAGYPAGQPQNKTRCVKGVWPNERAPMEHQCYHKRGFGPGGLYCRQHNPDALAAKEQAAQELTSARDREQERILRDAKRFAKRLGYGEPYYATGHRFKDCGYREYLLIKFEDVERLIAEREKKEQT